MYNIFKEEKLTKIEFVKVLIDLGFIHSQKLDLKFMIEFAMNLPMIQLLWTILLKSEAKELPVQYPKLNKVRRKDIFTIFAAILDIQVAEMLNHDDQELQETNNPLLFRDQNYQLVFGDFSELRKFSVKFANLKCNY